MVEQWKKSFALFSQWNTSYEYSKSNEKIGYKTCCGCRNCQDKQKNFCNFQGKILINLCVPTPLFKLFNLMKISE